MEGDYIIFLNKKNLHFYFYFIFPLSRRFRYHQCIVTLVTSTSVCNVCILGTFRLLLGTHTHTRHERRFCHCLLRTRVHQLLPCYKGAPGVIPRGTEWFAPIRFFNHVRLEIYCTYVHCLSKYGARYVRTDILTVLRTEYQTYLDTPGVCQRNDRRYSSGENEKTG